MSEAARQWISPEEYLDLEDQAVIKSEYFDGEVFAMAGADLEHNLLCANLMRELGNQLDESPCLILTSDQRVKVSETGLYTYPDLSIVCDEPQLEGTRPRNLVNPRLIIEVLSDTTADYDRGQKFEHYRCIATLREYVLVSAEQHLIECRTRKEASDEWTVTVCADPAGKITLTSIGCTLEMARVYRKVELPRPERRQPRSPQV